MKMSQTLLGIYLYQKNIRCLPEIQTLLSVLYFYLLNWATLCRKAGIVVILFIAQSSAVELLLTYGNFSVNIYGMNE